MAASTVGAGSGALSDPASIVVALLSCAVVAGAMIAHLRRRIACRRAWALPLRDVADDQRLDPRIRHMAGLAAAGFPVPDGLGHKRELHQMDVALVRRCVAQLLARVAG